MPVPASNGLPTWAPTVADVAKYVPARTIVNGVDGYGDPQRTFTAGTLPAASDVNAFIADAVAWVQIRTGAVDTSLYGFATTAAALRAAGMVEQANPDRPADQATAALLLQQANAAREDLARANEAATGTDPESPTAHLMPTYSFPAPNLFGDDYLIYD